MRDSLKLQEAEQKQQNNNNNNNNNNINNNNKSNQQTHFESDYIWLWYLAYAKSMTRIGRFQESFSVFKLAQQHSESVENNKDKDRKQIIDSLFGKEKQPLVVPILQLATPLVLKTW